MIDLRKYIRHLPCQYSISCCSSSATLLAYEMMLNSKKEYRYFSRLFLYYMTRKLQGRIGQPGAELYTTLDTLKNIGVCLENTWPFHFNRENTEPYKQAIAEADNYKISEYKSVSHDEYNFYLDLDIPIIIGMWTDKKFWKLTGNLKENIYSPEKISYERGHALTIVGYDNSINKGVWIVANSVGSKWGDHGYAMISYDCKDLIGESYIIESF